jgi:hypothetical protein
MTIRFNCPRCGSLIAFADKYAGGSARCLTCGQLLVVPQIDGDAPRAIEPKEEPDFPVPGFYTAVFINNWKIFFDRDNLTALVFVTAAVCFKFFAAGAPCLAYVIYFAAWGYLFGFYLTLIRETAVGGDKFPEIELGTNISFLWQILKPILLFALILFVVEIPFYIVSAIAGKSSETVQDLWADKTAMNLFLVFLFAGGLFLFPLTILKVAMMEDITELFGLRRFFVPLVKAFFPYLTVIAVLAVACVIEAHAKQYAPGGKESFFTVAGKLAMNLAGQAVAIISIRSIGLFYRHFSCFFDY